jgi:hypothetical protein
MTETYADTYPSPDAYGTFYGTPETDATYAAVYGATYGGVPFPQGPLDVAVELDLAGVWTDITTYVLQREGTSPPIQIQKGRPDETSQATPSSATMQWNNRDGRFSPRNPTGPYYGQLGRNTPLRISVPDSGTYLRFADDDQSYVSCPDSTALQLTADFDCRLDMWLDNYQACTLCGKWGTSTAHQAWCLALNGDGTLSLYWNDGSGVNSVQSTQPLPYLGRVALRAWFDASASQVVFYTAPTMSGTFTQLGSAVAVTADDYAQGASGQVVQVGYVDGFAGQGIVSSGCLGKVLEFSLYNASGTLVADPQFSAQTAGGSSFADTPGNTWTLEGTSSLSARSFRAHLECSSLPQLWDVTGTDVWTPVTASGVLRRLQQGNAPLPSPMKRGMLSLDATSDFLVYWPAEDPQGSTSIASGLPGGAPMRLGGSPSFQGQSGSPSADSVFACSAELVQVESSTWYGPVAPYTPGSEIGGGCLLAIPSGGLPDGSSLLSLNMSPGYLTVKYAAADGGTLEGDVAGLASITGPTGINGAALWVAISSTSAEATLTVLPLGDTMQTTYTTGTGINNRVINVTVNDGGAALSSTEEGHIWLSLTPPSLQDNAALLNAWSGETAAARVARLCSENGLSARIYGFPDNSMTMGDQTIDTLSNLLQYAETSDRGILYEPAECLGVGYRTLAALENQSPAVTLSYTAAVLGGDGSQGLQPTDDDQYTINDATVSRNNGSSYQVQVTSGPMSISPPPNGVGDYATQVTSYNAYDTQLPHLAGWITWIGTANQERYPVIPFNLSRPQLASLVYDLQNVRPGDYVQITNPPAWLPPGTIDQLAYGAAEKLGGYFWNLAWNAVPEDPYAVAVAGTGATDSAHADTDGSELEDDVSSGATTLSVATTGPSGVLWTTNSADFPFDIMIGGEQITVTDITGASSPQPFTVVRSVNGVVKAQSAGAAVNVYPTPVLALA